MSQWEPPRYDPAAHQRRLDDGIAPQGYPAQQPPRPWPPQQQYRQPPGQYPPQQQYAPPRGPQGPRRKRHTGRNVTLSLLGGFLALIVIIIAASSHGTSTPPAASGTGPTAGTSAPATPKAAAAAQTVTYVVTGSAADITYGPAGSDSSGTVPMSKTVKIPSSAPDYYAISAQLQGSGTVTCEILVDGKVISRSTASGGYNIGQCEIIQDPFSGKWQDANS